MSITITTGGITMTGGGVTFTAPPPSTPTAGWFIGGRAPYVSTVDRITYATDTATASVRGTTTVATAQTTATGNTTDGWIVVTTAFNRITYATDTATATSRGAISFLRANLAASTDRTIYGWYVGGRNPPYYSIVDRLTYATDTATTSVRGPLATASGYLAASGNTTDGWFGGGYNPSNALLSSIQRITYATDTATASIRGPLSTGLYNPAATGDDSYGWYVGGMASLSAPYNTLSTVQRITYATDTATASVRGPLTNKRQGAAASTDYTTYGWFGGGATYTPAGTISIVERITYATDTAATSTRGPLSAVRYDLSATSGVQ